MLAYHADEDGLPITGGKYPGAFVNRFFRLFLKAPSGRREITHAEAASLNLQPGDPVLQIVPTTATFELVNPLDKVVTTGLKYPAAVPRLKNPAKLYASIFVPPSTFAYVAEARKKRVAPEVKVLLFFGTGSELDRHGLRFFTERSPRCVFINVPGVEAGYDWTEGHTWAVGISTKIIADQIDGALGKGVAFIVDRMIAYSTGYQGWSDTIRNGLVDLSRLRGAFMFDCLYPEARVKEAIARLRQVTSDRARIALYAASYAGINKGTATPEKLGVKHTEWIKLVYQPSFQALTHLRVLAAGLHDHTIEWSEINPEDVPSLQSAIATLPARGTVISTPEAFQALHGIGPPKGAVTAEAWFNGNQKLATFFRGKLWKKSGKYPALVQLIWKHQVVGWDGYYSVNPAPDNLAEGSHDFMALEYTWECMNRT
ncbi:hypothetical protein GCM10010994_19480 [Chelatococcus reniformis]|uniref:Uncharacterized protein n=1 Tax=Chelatococcus reniformis TaxID=1494448 RepID=A0A916U7K9_9HYPH|nr:hypothetical protein GCM10010994_19480 [Chelatococcus reniformis]